MLKKISILIEKKDSLYFAYCPELEDYQVQDNSLDVVFEQLKLAVQKHLKNSDESKKETAGQSIIKLVAKFTEDLTEEEIKKFPTDAAAQHDHYLYGTQKK
ncbi:MAG: hypothetical protein AB4426_19670 [Xenococcaceae cyanobacterium]